MRQIRKHESRKASSEMSKNMAKKTDLPWTIIIKIIQFVQSKSLQERWAVFHFVSFRTSLKYKKPELTETKM